MPFSSTIIADIDHEIRGKFNNMSNRCLTPEDYKQTIVLAEISLENNIPEKIDGYPEYLQNFYKNLRDLLYGDTPQSNNKLGDKEEENEEKQTSSKQFLNGFNTKFPQGFIQPNDEMGCHRQKIDHYGYGYDGYICQIMDSSPTEEEKLAVFSNNKLVIFQIIKYNKCLLHCCDKNNEGHYTAIEITDESQIQTIKKIYGDTYGTEIISDKFIRPDQSKQNRDKLMAIAEHHEKTIQYRSERYLIESEPNDIKIKIPFFVPIGENLNRKDIQYQMEVAYLKLNKEIIIQQIERLKLKLKNYSNEKRQKILNAKKPDKSKNKDSERKRLEARRIEGNRSSPGFIPHPRMTYMQSKQGEPLWNFIRSNDNLFTCNRVLKMTDENYTCLEGLFMEDTKNFLNFLLDKNNGWTIDRVLKMTDDKKYNRLQGLFTEPNKNFLNFLLDKNNGWTIDCVLDMLNKKYKRLERLFREDNKNSLNFLLDKKNGWTIDRVLKMTDKEYNRLERLFTEDNKNFLNFLLDKNNKWTIDHVIFKMSKENYEALEGLFTERNKKFLNFLLNENNKWTIGHVIFKMSKEDYEALEWLFKERYKNFLGFLLKNNKEWPIDRVLKMPYAKYSRLEGLFRKENKNFLYFILKKNNIWTIDFVLDLTDTKYNRLEGLFREYNENFLNFRTQQCKRNISNFFIPPLQDQKNNTLEKPSQWLQRRLKVF